jgi:hypothetical protein
MKRVRGGYGILGLLVVLFLVVAFLPTLRRAFAPVFPEGFRGGKKGSSKGSEGFRTQDCKGVLCKEGEFCQENVCRPVMAPITNNYFPGK